MATHTIKTIWRENNIFDTDIDGHRITIDLGTEAGGSDAGPRPKKLLLVAAAGCSGLDVAEIYRKMRLNVSRFEIQIDAPMAPDYPMDYTSLTLVYEFWGKNLPQEKLERACRLSFEQYCGVLAMYKKAVPITYSVVIHEE